MRFIYREQAAAHICTMGHSCTLYSIIMVKAASAATLKSVVYVSGEAEPKMLKIRSGKIQP